MNILTAEVGMISGGGRAMYAALARDQETTTIAQFYDRTNEWMRSHGVRLGEGLLSIRRNEDEKDTNYPVKLILDAPIIEGL